VTVNIAIITARGGSKRIPRKNIKDFLGKPIIAYSIAAALAAECFDEVMVSTDDNEIAEVALRFGAVVPFFRSAEMANDYATTADVLLEVLNEYSQLGKTFDNACCIYPTAPFVTAERLNQAYNLLKQTGADTVLPVARFSFPVQRALTIENNRLKVLWPEHVNTRSQDLAPAYYDSGQFYFFQVAHFLETRDLYGSNCVPIELPESEVQDIDTLEDWKIAEMKYQILHQSGVRNGQF
jgi:N-acylneuraminate cytidylyltransferase